MAASQSAWNNLFQHTLYFELGQMLNTVYLTIYQYSYHLFCTFIKIKIQKFEDLSLKFFPKFGSFLYYF
jgi:hypothetical protein